MLKIENLKINLTEEKKEIIHGVSLTINPGEIHLLNGKNGSGKSTLVNTLMGNPSFKITEGSVKIQNEGFPTHIIEKLDFENIQKAENENIKNSKTKNNNFREWQYYNLNLTNMQPNERALAGLYLANQYPTEIPGVSLMSFLRLAYNNRQSADEQLSVFKFKRFVEEKAASINYPAHLLKRNLNEGFSGGEKKKTEILQMLILSPKYIFLDEIDSGLDKHSVKEVFEGLKAYSSQQPGSSMIIITHYDRVFDYLKIDHIHEMQDGLFVEAMKLS